MIYICFIQRKEVDDVEENRGVIIAEKKNEDFGTTPSTVTVSSVVNLRNDDDSAAASTESETSLVNPPNNVPSSEESDLKEDETNTNTSKIISAKDNNETEGAGENDKTE